MTHAQAQHLFAGLVKMGWPVVLKHRGGQFSIEVPVLLHGEPSFGKGEELKNMAERAGLHVFARKGMYRIM